MHFKNTVFNRTLSVSFAAVLATTALHAIPKGPCDPKPPEMCCEEPKPGPFGFAFPMDMGIACPRDFYVHAEALAFQAKSGGLEYGISSASSTTPPINGDVLGFSNNHHDWDYNPGARFGMGFFLDHDAWCIDFNWTWVNITNYKTENTSPNGSVIYPTTLIPGDGSDTTVNVGPRSSAAWEASYNTLDARLGKPYHVSRYLVFQPHIGIRAGWIDQHYATRFSGSQTTANTGSRSQADNDFWGFGTRMGLDTDWDLGKGWCLFGNLATSMLFGKFTISQNFDENGSSSGLDGQFDYDFYQNVPNFEMALGLGWGTYFDSQRYHIGLRLAYEFHQWWNQLNIRQFFGGSPWSNDTVSRGDLTLNGFSFRVQLDI